MRWIVFLAIVCCAVICLSEQPSQPSSPVRVKRWASVLFGLFGLATKVVGLATNIRGKANQMLENISQDMAAGFEKMEEELSRVREDLGTISKQLDEQKVTVDRILEGVIDLQYKQGIDQIEAAFTVFMQGSHNLRESLKSMDSTVFQLETASKQHLSPATVLKYLAIVRTTKGQQAVEELGSYVITVKAKHLFMMTVYYSYKNDTTSLTRIYEDFNRDTREIIKSGGVADLYDGDMANGLRHGKGVLYGKDGSQYEGSFSNGLQHGQGVLVRADGTTHRGRWTNGVEEALPTGPPCLPGWELREGKCFYFSGPGDTVRSYKDALSKCTKLKAGATLAAFRDQDELFWMRDGRLRQNPSYLGGSDVKQEGAWTWEDGTPWDFMDWPGNEPNGGRQTNCLAIQEDTISGRPEPWWLNDEHCDIKKDHGYVCSYTVRASSQQSGGLIIQSTGQPWKGGSWGEASRCDNGQLATGACGSGKDKNCRINRNAYSTGVRCSIWPGFTTDSCSDVYSAGWGTNLLCPPEQPFIMGLCGSGGRKDCWGHSHTLTCCKGRYEGLAVTSSGECSWRYTAYWGQPLSCSRKDEFLNGYCGSGTYRDCPYGHVFGIKCCQVAINY